MAICRGLSLPGGRGLPRLSYFDIVLRLMALASVLPRLLELLVRTISLRISRLQRMSSRGRGGKSRSLWERSSYDSNRGDK